MEVLENFDPDLNYIDIISENHIFSSYDSIDSFLSDNPISFNDKNFISIICQNIRSMNCNLDKLLCIFEESNMPDVLILTETWYDGFSPNIIPGYDGYHSVRIGRSGGVSIYVKSQIPSSKIDSLSFTNEFIEICTVKVAFNDKHLFLGGIYRPHSGSIDSFTDALEYHLNSNPLANSQCIFAGDFNANLRSNTGDVDRLVHMMHSHHYLQTITDITRPEIGHSAPSLIDHIWINQISSHNSGVIKTGITDHHTLFLQLPFSLKKSNSNKIKITFRDCSDFYQSIFSNNLSTFDWQQIKNDDASIYTENFCSTLNNIYQKSFPLRTKMVTNRFFKNPWMTKEVRKLSEARKQYHSLYIAGVVSHSEYATYRNKVTALLRKQKISYYKNCFSRNANNMKASWNLIRNICYGRQANTIDVIKLNDETFYDDTQIASTFNNFFANIATDLANSLPISSDNPYAYIPNHHNIQPLFDPITPDECSNIISMLKSTKQNTNNISVDMFKKHHQLFLPILCEIVNLSFTSGVFPTCFKHATVVPIFKKGDRSNVSNYRPIAILLFLSKVFERCIYNRLMEFAAVNNLFTPHQYGFLKGKSTQNALIQLTDFIYDCFNGRDGSFCINVFVDFHKCFDTIDHEILIRKLELYGVSTTLLNIVKNYLSNRTQSVRIKESISPPLHITKGVPQGSILGPLLFLFFINDLPNISNVFTPVLYADDTTLSFKCHSIPQALSLCNQELLKFYNWAVANKLSINFDIDKTYFMIHTFRNLNLSELNLNLGANILPKSNGSKFLGVIVDEKLKFKNHIDYISKKISKSIGIIYKLSQLKMPFKILKQLYYNLIYSYLNYNVCCYASTYDSHLNKLYLLQKRAIRIMNNASFQAHTDPLFFSNGILKIQDIYKLNIGLYMYQHNSSAHFLRPHDYATRGHDNPISPYARLTLTQNSISVVGPNIWNSIPDDIKNSPSRNSFKFKYKKFLLSFYSVNQTV